VTRSCSISILWREAGFNIAIGIELGHVGVHIFDP
jgi:hypothetical protein